MSQQTKMVEAGFTLGILGGGQLGRMSAMAAARLGIKVVIYCPEKNSPASHVSSQTIIAKYDDLEALKIFSDKCDVISYEFENIPIETIDYLESLNQKNILPDKKLLNISQDRIKEKTFLNDNSISTTRWNYVSTIDDIKNTADAWKCNSFILKTTRFGYDGKGQIKSDINDLNNNIELLNFLEKSQDQALIMEDIVNFTCEVSVVVARDRLGKIETYGSMLNNHINHILHKTTIPATIPTDTEKLALTIAKSIANKVNLIGVLTVEFFVLECGGLLVNEIAPRTHNSGHWSIDACAVSQFENHVRTVCGLPVGSSARHSNAQMINLIGSDIKKIDEYIGQPKTCIHLYGKTEVRDGRKMGHITFLEPLSNS